MTAARLAWHGSGIWITDDVDRGVTGSETGVPHVGGSDQVGHPGFGLVISHGEYCRPQILRKSLFALKQTSRRKNSSAAILSLSSYFLSATSVGFFFLRSVSSIRFLGSFALITTMNIIKISTSGCSRHISRQSGDFIARVVDTLFKIKAPRLNDVMTFFQHCTRENRSINNVLTDVFKAKDTSAAQDKTSDENEDLRNQITALAERSTFRPQATVRTILSHQRGVYRTEYRYELSDVNHLSETSSEERETDTKKTTLTIDPVDEPRSTIANPSDQMARSEVLIRDSLENNDILRKASKSIIEIRSSCTKPAVGGSLRKSGGRPSVNWTDTSAMGGHRLINDLTKASGD
ncbi:hypothetical protein ALC60_14131 [Trachymyrmex zeteki]|uniref:Uncharacterized protein n=1 Tax=Mycetomoellerius zeteki TaxID=64791 RepID=A0A151WG77_9HYME|nr:hypothetical protein ALC60_14131 [Trachymyrmex zeteki]